MKRNIPGWLMIAGLSFLLIPIQGFSETTFQAKKKGTAEPILTLSLQAKINNKEPVKGEILLEVEILPEYHINSSAPSLDFLIPTRVEMEKVPGVTFLAPAYPPGKDKKFGFTDQPISIYEGKVLLRIPFQVAKEGLGKNLSLQGILSYQGCTESACLPPRKDKFHIEIALLK